jgi:toxin ParE1/3/4
VGKPGYARKGPLEIRWSAASVRHLEQVTGYIESDNIRAAGTVRRKILGIVRRLGELPLTGRVGRIDGTREAVVPRTPFIVVYQLSETAVEILGIWHGARQWPESLEVWNP